MSKLCQSTENSSKPLYRMLQVKKVQIKPQNIFHMKLQRTPPQAPSSPLSSPNMSLLKTKTVAKNGCEQRNLSKYRASLHLHGWDGVGVTHGLGEWRKRARLLVDISPNEEGERCCIGGAGEALHPC